MQSDVSAYPPVNYTVMWLLIAIGCAVALIAWYGFVLWLTRKKRQRTVATLKPADMTPIDIPAIQAKYLALIAEIEQALARGEIKSRAAHQKLSILLRYFAQEAHGLRAFSLTLSDLRRTRFTQLADAIESYYVPEFHQVLEGDIHAALKVAKEVVSTWS